MKTTINGVTYTRIERTEIKGDFVLIHTYAKGDNNVELLVKYDGRVRSQSAFEKALMAKLNP